MAAAATHELLLPRPHGGMLRGAALAFAAHGALVLALTFAVQWRTSEPEPMSAELWAAVPQAAPPPPVSPPPAPAPPEKPIEKAPEKPPEKIESPAPDPQIAIAREREKRAERDKAERDKSEKADRARAEQERQKKEREAEAKKRERDEQVQEERLAQQRQRNLERMMGQVGSSPAPNATPAAATAGPSASYTGKLVAAIKPNIVFTESLSGNPAAEVEVRAGLSGSILSRRLVRSSGNKEWDEAVLRAIDRTGTLPRDVDGRVPAVMTMVFRPQE